MKLTFGCTIRSGSHASSWCLFLSILRCQPLLLHQWLPFLQLLSLLQCLPWVPSWWVSLSVCLGSLLESLLISLCDVVACGAWREDILVTRKFYVRTRTALGHVELSVRTHGMFQSCFGHFFWKSNALSWYCYVYIHYWIYIYPIVKTESPQMVTLSIYRRGPTVFLDHVFCLQREHTGQKDILFWPGTFV